MISLSFKQKLGWGLASLGFAAALPVAVLEYKKRLAIQEIINEKLSNKFDFLIEWEVRNDLRPLKKRHQILPVKFQAPYGINDEKEKIYKPGLKKIAGTNLEQYLKSCSRYTGFKDEDFNMDLRCLKPLSAAQRAWQAKELMEGDFGFFLQKAPQIDANTNLLSKELRDQIPYYVNVADILCQTIRMYHVFTNLNCLSNLSSFYSEGPCLTYERAKPNGAIGVYEYGNILIALHTPWGEIKITDLLIGNDSARSDCRLRSLIKSPNGFLPKNKLFYHNSLNGEEHKKIKENWKLIRDSVFLEFQRRDKGKGLMELYYKDSEVENLLKESPKKSPKEGIKEKIIENVQSVYDNVFVIYGYLPLRIMNVAVKIRSKYFCEK